jgi:protein-tyrosine phosphatase
VGRTGTLGAAYWIWKGLSAKDAVARIRQGQPNAVESPEQQKCLYEFERFAKDSENRSKISAANPTHEL